MVIANEQLLDVQLGREDVADKLLGSEVAHLLGEVEQETGVNACAF